ncbi:hypothetical protein Tco_0564922 [Tanacetum coccineum]
MKESYNDLGWRKMLLMRNHIRDHVLFDETPLVFGVTWRSKTWNVERIKTHDQESSMDDPSQSQQHSDIHHHPSSVLDSLPCPSTPKLLKI